MEPLCNEGILNLENITFKKPCSKYIKMMMIQISVIYFFLMALAMLILLSDSKNATVILIAVECTLAVAYVVNVALSRKICDFRGYALRDNDVSYRSRIFFPTVTTVPFSKIQQVSVRMNPLSRIFKLYYVDIINGSQNTWKQISIPGLTQEEAEQIKSLLISKADCNE